MTPGNYHEPNISKPSGLHPESVSLADGAQVLVRPIVPDDLELERCFITELSPQSRRFRFLDTMVEPSEQMLWQFTTMDPSHSAALAAVDPHTQHFIGVARFSLNPDRTAEIAVAVSDNWQHRGVGSLLARKLIDIARHRGIRQLYSIDSGANHAMSRLADSLGFCHRPNPEDISQVLYTLDLAPGP